MKKTMFITSVIMVVVMAIALTTSSLAWFSAAGSSKVSTSSMTLQAATNASEGLLIGATNDAFSTTAVYPTATANSTTLTAGVASNLRPVGLYDDDAVLDALVGEKFCGRYVESSSGAAKWSNEVSQYNDHFAGKVYVANSGNAAVNIKATINFASVTGATLYVAVLANTAQDVTTGTYEILEVASCNSGSTKTTLTNIDLASSAFVVGNTVASTFTSTAIGGQTGRVSSVSLGYAADNEAYSHYQEFIVLAWYSADLAANNSGPSRTYGSFTVDFEINA